MAFLLIGGDSEIATATLAESRRRNMPAVATTRRADRVAAGGRVLLDLARAVAEWEPPPQIEAACIFAAIGHLADCARDPEGAALINVTRTLELAERLSGLGIPVLFLSTNQVFDGSRPQMPADAPLCPQSEYGRQKARTETRLQAMMAAGAPVAILRFGKIVSPGMALLRQWDAALAAGQKVRAFPDMVMAPTPAAVAAAAVVSLLAERARGIWQLTGPQDIAYAAIAAHIARRRGAAATLVEPVAAATAGMPQGATPGNTTLDSARLYDRFGIAAPQPWSVIDRLLDDD